MTETPTPEKRTKTLQVRMTPTEYTDYESFASRHDQNVSDCARQALGDQVSSQPRVRREKFEADLAAGTITEVGRFQNVHGEEYVLYGYGRHPETVFITGDELGWVPGATYSNGQLANVFLLSPDERTEIDKIVNGGETDPTRLGVAAGERVKKETRTEVGEHKPNTNLGRAFQSLLFWRGGCAAAEAGYPYGSAGHQEFFMGFMAAVNSK